VGGDRPVAVDVRVIVATHRNLDELVRQNTFRQDLYHRIYVFPLLLPPLRERVEDIPVLVDNFGRQVTVQNGWKEKAFAAEAIEELKRYAWPGNVRELRNVVERLLLLSAGEQVDSAAVRQALPLGSTTGSATLAHAQDSSSTMRNGTLAERVSAFERQVLLAELKRHNHHMTNVARALGLERSHLYKKCQQLGIDLRAVRRSE